MAEKKKIALPIIVEGRYDKNAISQIFDATVITTGGFSVFNSKEKQALIKKLADRGGIILMVDPDAGGRQIRSFISSIIPKDKIFNAYVPEIKGKERRKSAPSKSGLLGVEGVGREVLERALMRFVSTDACENTGAEKSGKMLTKLDFYNDGLSGGVGSAEKRRELCLLLSLPRDMSAAALIEAINLLYSYEQYKEALAKITEMTEKKG